MIAPSFPRHQLGPKGPSAEMAGAAARALDHGLQQRAKSAAVALDLRQGPGANVMAGKVSALERGDGIADRTRIWLHSDAEFIVEIYVPAAPVGGADDRQAGQQILDAGVHRALDRRKRQPDRRLIVDSIDRGWIEAFRDAVAKLVDEPVTGSHAGVPGYQFLLVDIGFHERVRENHRAAVDEDRQLMPFLGVQTPIVDGVEQERLAIDWLEIGDGYQEVVVEKHCDLSGSFQQRFFLFGVAQEHEPVLGPTPTMQD